MRRNVLWLSAIYLFANTLNASAQVYKNGELEISQLEDHVWVVETSDKASMYILEGTEKSLLIDTGTRCEKLDEVVREITRKPLLVVLTHAHGDHAGNIGYFKEVYLHAADTVLMDKSYPGKLHFVEDGFIFDLGGKQIEVRHMPAHTPGSIVLLDRKAGSCYTGDAFGSGQVWLQLKPYSPMKRYIASCRKMEQLMSEGISKLYCGHYPHVKGALPATYLRDMLKLAVALDNGTDRSAIPFNQKVSIGCDHPMIATEGSARIVYDPEHVK